MNPKFLTIVVMQCRIHHNGLEYTSFGKPNPFVFRNAEVILKLLQPSCHDGYFMDKGNKDTNSFKTLYMIGDNPLVDIRGALQVVFLPSIVL